MMSPEALQRLSIIEVFFMTEMKEFDRTAIHILCRKSLLITLPLTLRIKTNYVFIQKGCSYSCIMRNTASLIWIATGR